MNRELKCPHCGFIDEEWYEIDSDSGYYENWECGECEKEFCVEIQYCAEFNISKK